MSELSKKFKIEKPRLGNPHYELFIEGDWNDADYVTKKTEISVEDFEKDDYMLYYLSYLDSAEGHFMEKSEDWDELFYDCAEEFYDFLPYGYEQEIHSITEMKLTYKENGKSFPVKIPTWKSLFKDEAEKKEKVLAAKKAKEDAEDAEFCQYMDNKVAEAMKVFEEEEN